MCSRYIAEEKPHVFHEVYIGEIKMIEPGQMIGTIIMILLMGAVSMIAVIFAARKPTSINKGLRRHEQS